MLRFFVAYSFYGNEITDEGVEALANLPKLVSLELWDIETMTNRVFEHFTRLKRVSFSGIKNIEKGVRDLIQKCSGLQEIQLLPYYGSDETIYGILKSAADALKGRTNRISIFCGNFKVRMTPMKSKKNPSTNILFKLYYNEKNINLDFITYDFDALAKEVSLLY